MQVRSRQCTAWPPTLTTCLGKQRIRVEMARVAPTFKITQTTRRRSVHSHGSMGHLFRHRAIIGVCPKLTRNYQAASRPMPKAIESWGTSLAQLSQSNWKMGGSRTTGRTRRNLWLIRKLLVRMLRRATIQILRRSTLSKVRRIGRGCKLCRIRATARSKSFWWQIVHSATRICNIVTD